MTVWDGFRSPSSKVRVLDLSVLLSDGVDDLIGGAYLDQDPSGVSTGSVHLPLGGGM